LSLPEAVVVTEHVSIYFQVLCMLWAYNNTL
jgi:hypothetical protein